MRFLIIRHGLTDANASDISQGRIDNTLNEIGQEQARKTAVRLAAENVAAVYASPLIRAQETALKIAAPHNLRVITTPDLSEIDFGIFDGKPWPLMKAFRESIVGPFENAEHPGGETFQAVLARAENFISQTLISHPSASAVVAVTHGSFLRALIAKLTVTPLRELFNQPLFANCSLTVIEYGADRGAIILNNDTKHLVE